MRTKSEVMDAARVALTGSGLSENHARMLLVMLDATWEAATITEREACAKIAEQTMAGDYDPGATIAEAIRAR